MQFSAETSHTLIHLTMKKTSYKEMLRDRVSKMIAVDLALRWVKAKSRWIDHVYDHFISIMVEKKERNKVTRAILGINEGEHKSNLFDFNKTIDWEELDDDDRRYWEAVESWVIWFQNNILYIEQAIKNGNSITKWTNGAANSELLAKFLIKNLS